MIAELPTHKAISQPTAVAIKGVDLLSPKETIEGTFSHFLDQKTTKSWFIYMYFPLLYQYAVEKKYSPAALREALRIRMPSTVLDPMKQ